MISYRREVYQLFKGFLSRSIQWKKAKQNKMNDIKTVFILSSLKTKLKLCSHLGLCPDHACFSLWAFYFYFDGFWLIYLVAKSKSHTSSHSLVKSETIMDNIFISYFERNLSLTGGFLSCFLQTTRDEIQLQPTAGLALSAGHLLHRHQ